MIHLVALAAFGLVMALQPEEAEPEPEEEQSEEEVSKEEFEVALVREPEPPDPERQRKEERQKERERREEETEPEKKPEPKKKKKEEQEQQQPREKPPRQPPERLKRKAVEQQTNEKEPNEANFLSDENNRVEEEMVARETTNKNVDPTKTQGEAADEKSEERQREKGNPDHAEEEASGEKIAARATRPDREPARPKKRREPPQPPEERRKRPREPRERAEDRREEAPERPKREPSDDPDKPRPTEPTERAKVPKRKAPDKPLPMPNVSDYDRVFDGEQDRQKAEEVQEQQSKGAGHAMYERMEKSKGSVKATLENYVTEVKPGNHTALNARSSVGASYIARVHREIHPLWGGQYLPRLDNRYGPNHPLSNPDLRTVLEFVIDGQTGKLESVNIVESSGQTQFDMEAVRVSKMVAPHPTPPDKIVSPDGNVYMHWRFWRNQRQCGTFGVSLYRVETGGGEKAESGKAGEMENR